MLQDAGDAVSFSMWRRALIEVA